MKKLFIVAVALWPLLALAAPQVLIVQLPIPDRETPPVVPLASVFADELTRQGRVQPIVWSLTDPLFRRAIDERRLTEPVEQPNLNQARKAAREIGAEYLLWLAPRVAEGVLDVEAQLFRPGSSRRAWGYRNNASVTVIDQPDWESAARSIARVAIEELARGPFRRHAPLAPPPDRDPGPVETPVEIPPANPEPPRPSEMERAEKLLHEGKTAEGIAVLRDAVDARPGDALLRTRLARALLEAGFLPEAAAAAEGASSFPDAPAEISVIAASAYLGLGDLTRALTHAERARTLAPNDPQVNLLLGEYAVARGDVPGAIQAYDAVIAQQDGFDARLGRAVARALAGDVEGARADLAALPATDDATRAVAYARATALLERWAGRLIGELRDTVRLGRVSPRSREVIDRARKASREADGLVVVAESLRPPSARQTSHERRLLAHKLLALGAKDALTFAENGDEDDAAEATLSIGEAAQHFAKLHQTPDEAKTGP